MDKSDHISTKNYSLSDWAIDGLINGLVGGIAMLFVLTVLVLSSGGSPDGLLGSFSSVELASPVQGLISHLAVSSIYGVLYGVLIWPVLLRLSSAKLLGWLGGVIYGALLLYLAQVAILPGTNSPLAQLPFGQWALGHAVYGLVLGVLFARKLVQKGS